MLVKIFRIIQKDYSANTALQYIFQKAAVGHRWKSLKSYYLNAQEKYLTVLQDDHQMRSIIFTFKIVENIFHRLTSGKHFDLLLPLDWFSIYCVEDKKSSEGYIIYMKNEHFIKTYFPIIF